MVTFPNAKINIGLQVTGKRADGFHNIETIFYPIPLKDALEIIPSSTDDPITFSTSGNSILGSPDDNLCLKAYQLLKKDFQHIPSIQLHLHKVIPMGAGLGGGSADGAFTLQLLNQQFGLQIPTAQLMEYALTLGSDCPFFILNEPSYATGRGEKLEPVVCNLSAYKILIVNPGIHINTRTAFEQLTLRTSHTSLREAIQFPVEDWRHAIKNDFESPVFNQYPAVQDIAQQLYAAGASFSSMSGTGSTVFGIFKKELSPILSFPESYFQKWV